MSQESLSDNEESDKQMELAARQENMSKRYFESVRGSSQKRYSLSDFFSANSVVYEQTKVQSAYTEFPIKKDTQ
jgi:hypothetical protein